MEAINSIHSNWNVSRSQQNKIFHLNESQIDTFEDFITEAKSSESSESSKSSKASLVVDRASQYFDEDSPVTQEWLQDNLGASKFLASHPRISSDLNENPEQAEKFIQGASEGREGIQDALSTMAVDRASQYFDDDSPITREWLEDNLDPSKFLASHPEFSSDLNENPEQAEKFMQGDSEAREVIQDAFSTMAVDLASQYFDDDSPITQEWLEDNLDSAEFLASHPGFSSYLNENSEKAGGFVNLEA